MSQPRALNGPGDPHEPGEPDDNVGPVEPSDLVPVATLGSPAEALVVAALLRAAGLQPWIAGQMLTDEFALTQARMGLAQTTIHVPRAQVREAREVIEEGRREGRMLRDE